MKNILFVLCVITSCSIYAQSKLRVGIKMNLGLYGITNGNKQLGVDTYFNIGLTSHVFLTEDEKFSLGVDFLYNYSSFGTGTYLDLYGSADFTMKNSLIPLKANFHFKKWTLSAGLIHSFVLNAKFQNNEYYVEDGEIYTSNSEERRLAFFKRKYDLQGILGARYAVGSRVNIGLETTFYFENNDFYHKKYPNYSFNVRNLNYTSISCTAIYFMN
ncbi:MAG TPA: hypothetical protein VK169_02840 [Saprospiraceae bacterium]|nr:hypothetical protein [Saprospiraceae bacterium]